MFSYRLILPVLLASASATSWAADPAKERQLAPLNAAAPAKAAAYDSAFAGYRAYQDPQVANWKETNAAIAGTSGHAGHAGHDMGKMQHGSQPAPARPDPHAGHDMSKMKPAEKPAAPAKPDPHAGHEH